MSSLFHDRQYLVANALESAVYFCQLKNLAAKYGLSRAMLSDPLKPKFLHAVERTMYSQKSASMQQEIDRATSCTGPSNRQFRHA